MVDDWGDTPPTAFHFSVSFGPSPPLLDCAFQEVGGIAPEMELEAVAEGGENRFVHQLPKGMKYPRLTLQRGVAPQSSPLVLWCRSVLEGGLALPIVTMPVNVFLLGADAQPLCAWSFVNAFPVRWEVQSFNATKNELALEKIELSYAYSTRLV
jgi:phage tail-like protein